MLHERWRPCIQGWNLRLTAHFHAVKFKRDISNICAFATAALCLLQCRDCAQGTLPFQRVSGSIWCRSPWNSSPRALPGAPCELVSSSFTSPGWAEQNINLTPHLEYYLGQKGERQSQISPRMQRAKRSYSSLQVLLTCAWNLKDLKMLYRIYSTFLLQLPWKRMLYQIYNFCPQKIGKLLTWVFLQILNLGSSGTTWTHCWVLKHLNYCLDLHLN